MSLPFGNKDAVAEKRFLSDVFLAGVWRHTSITTPPEAVTSWYSQQWREAGIWYIHSIKRPSAFAQPNHQPCLSCKLLLNSAVLQKSSWDLCRGRSLQNSRRAEKATIFPQQGSSFQQFYSLIQRQTVFGKEKTMFSDLHMTINEHFLRKFLQKWIENNPLPWLQHS